MDDITQLLHRWRAGDREAENTLFEAVLPTLKRLAQRFMQRERPDHSLEATELVDQIYFKLVAAKDRDWRSRGHFYAIAARAMRRYLIDHARGRPGVVHLEIEGLENILPAGDQKTDLAVAVDQLLEELGQTKPELVQVVEMKYFLGLSNEEVADALGLTVRTMQRRWSQARNWLFERMETVRVERQAR